MGEAPAVARIRHLIQARLRHKRGCIGSYSRWDHSWIRVRCRWLNPGARRRHVCDAPLPCTPCLCVVSFSGRPWRAGRPAAAPDSQHASLASRPGHVSEERVSHARVSSASVSAFDWGPVCSHGQPVSQVLSQCQGDRECDQRPRERGRRVFLSQIALAIRLLPPKNVEEHLRVNIT